MSERTSDAGQQPVAGVVPDATDPQHPEWWYTAVTLEQGFVYDEHRRVVAGHRLLAYFYAEEPAREFVAWWNDLHGSSDAAVTDDATMGDGA